MTSVSDTTLSKPIVALTVCSVVSTSARATLFANPEIYKIDPNMICHIGPYFGARNSPALEAAQSIIYLKPGNTDGYLCLVVKESSTVLNHMLMRARSGNYIPEFSLPQDAVSPAPTTANSELSLKRMVERMLTPGLAVSQEEVFPEAMRTKQVSAPRHEARKLETTL